MSNFLNAEAGDFAVFFNGDCAEIKTVTIHPDNPAWFYITFNEQSHRNACYEYSLEKILNFMYSKDTLTVGSRIFKTCDICAIVRGPGNART